MTLPPTAILAGGLATRLKPLTEHIPKSMVEVAGEPFIAHQLRLLKRRGVHRIVLLVGHLSEQIEAFCGDGSAFGLDIAYSHDGERKRGTGGAVRNALPLLGEEFFVTYGDSYLDVPLDPLVEVRRRTEMSAVMAVYHNSDWLDPSNVIFDGAKVVLHDKSARGQCGVEWIDFGLSLLTAKALAAWKGADPFDLSELTGLLAREGRLAGIEVHDRFYELGKPEGLVDTEAHLRSLRLAAERDGGSGREARTDDCSRKRD